MGACMYDPCGSCCPTTTYETGYGVGPTAVVGGPAFGVGGVT
jgi:hypothetical protein